MTSGKTLPCFPAYDIGARSCGYIADRFLTGLRPQEYYFHCMSGREGLVDTAVKTSRSGYLQRCMVKNLESLKCCYDYTVRDNDGSIVQFYYGEDALDVTRSGYNTNFKFLAENAKSLSQQLQLEEVLPQLSQDEAEVKKAWKKAAKELKSDDKHVRDTSLPVMTRLSPGRYLGAIPPKLNDQIEEFLKKNPLGNQEERKETKKKDSKKKKDKKDKENEGGNEQGVTDEDFRNLMKLRYMRTLVAPGEAVGVLAAQSVG
eukprot:CAMPEP_0197860256 /NCGR_PEP_ID=MMETSP1438-20131217/35500_1 /TAXON_ID=1461541 /ORGANISM="Pterosperma sp., Strain CCMP1384" /LENGTH=258 /DNA_ID=CAMNT_0043477049 /DNA_START=25 /DNA_END=797 /DNA_ORIENTATION=+